MRVLVIIPLVAMLQMSACDMTGGPHKTQTEVELQLRQYFPRGHVIASPDREIIVAVTCVHGLGKPVIEEIAKSLPEQRGICRLREARRLPLKFSPYRFLVLVFDEYAIRLDMDTNQHSIVGSDSESLFNDGIRCSFAPAPAVSTRDAVP